jgi:hypothetical protein
MCPSMVPHDDAVLPAFAPCACALRRGAVVPHLIPHRNSVGVERRHTGCYGSARGGRHATYVPQLRVPVDAPLLSFVFFSECDNVGARCPLVSVVMA